MMYQVQVSGSKRFRTFSYDGYGFHYFPERIKEGVTQNENDIRITDYERTVLDSINDIEKAGGLSEFFKYLKMIPYLDEDKLITYLDKYDKQFLYQKTGFLLEYLKDIMGAINKVPISDWDLSYAVNLRAPVLLIQKFLPSMRNTNGIIVFNQSASVMPYMSAYEIFKSAQVELCSTLSEENTESNIVFYSIAPGFVKTDTAIKAVEIVASSMGITVEDFYKSQEDYIVDAEIAGVGYAVSVVNARQYHGKETMSYQVLVDSGLMSNNAEKINHTQRQVDYDKLLLLFTSIADVFYDQYQSWQRKNLFQKQFILSDFKKQMGLPAESFKKQLEALQMQIQNHQWDNFLSSKDMFTNYSVFINIKSNYFKAMKKI